MRIMDVPPFPRTVEVSNVESFLRTRLNGETVMFPEQAIALLGYMCCPNDGSARDHLMCTLRCWGRGSQQIPPGLGRVQHEWLRVADVVHTYYDLSQGHHQKRRGGASIGKAITLVDAKAKSRGTGEANLWKLWGKHKDVAHLIAAAAFVCYDVRLKHRRSRFLLPIHALIPFQIVMLIPDLVVAVAIEFQRVGLESVPYSRTEPTFDPDSLWRISDNINVMALAPQIRKVSAQDICVLNDRRAGNRGRANRHETTPVSV